MKKTNSSGPATSSPALRATCLGLALLFTASATLPAHATPYADQRVARSVEGKVHDSDDAPLQGAVVYLKDSRTLAVKSFLSDDEGTFHFGQLSQNTDYELYAEFGGKRSKSKSISSFDNKNAFNFTLKIDAKK